jgi:hypothetical protein
MPSRILAAASTRRTAQDRRGNTQPSRLSRGHHLHRRHPIAPRNGTRRDHDAPSRCPLAPTARPFGGGQCIATEQSNSDRGLCDRGSSGRGHGLPCACRGSGGRHRRHHRRRGGAIPPPREGDPQELGIPLRMSVGALVTTPRLSLDGSRPSTPLSPLTPEDESALRHRRGVQSRRFVRNFRAGADAEPHSVVSSARSMFARGSD